MEKKKKYIISLEILSNLIANHDEGDSLVLISDINKNILELNGFKPSKDELLEVEKFLNSSFKKTLIEFKVIRSTFGIDEPGIYSKYSVSYLSFVKEGLDTEISKINSIINNSDASVYCESSKIALANSNQSTKESITKMASMMANQGLHKVSYDTVIGQIVDNTKQFVNREKWNSNDKKGFSWFLGILCKAASQSHDKFLDKYDKLFVDSFNNHFYKN